MTGGVYLSSMDYAVDTTDLMIQLRYLFTTNLVQHGSFVQ